MDTKKLAKAALCSNLAAFLNRKHNSKQLKTLDSERLSTIFGGVGGGGGGVEPPIVYKDESSSKCNLTD
ncbi:hypothetical protein ACFOEE_14540 [Pseudoalteromonas fenneropenaei]|uniref:Bacteriocin n=1 Tax=Pseudoalteromonas fenneropenaei TaxID=1737459 RepID=A0ABV7CM89_9GAMM